MSTSVVNRCQSLLNFSNVFLYCCTIWNTCIGQEMVSSALVYRHTGSKQYQRTDGGTGGDDAVEHVPWTSTSGPYGIRTVLSKQVMAGRSDVYSLLVSTCSGSTWGLFVMLLMVMMTHHVDCQFVECSSAEFTCSVIQVLPSLATLPVLSMSVDFQCDARDLDLRPTDISNRGAWLA